MQMLEGSVFLTDVMGHFTFSETDGGSKKGKLNAVAIVTHDG
jgi:hypothetical protein